MEHCKKLVLIPHETLSRFHDKPISHTPGQSMGELDQEMHKILQNKAHDSEKWKMYDQTLQRYLHFANEQRKPVHFELPTLDTETVAASGAAAAAASSSSSSSSSPAGTQDDHPFDEQKKFIQELVPRRCSKTAGMLFDMLTSPAAQTLIRWDSKGHVFIRGNSIQQSSIYDLINDSQRFRKTVQAVGWEEFCSVLRDLNIPFELIGNDKYKTFIQSSARDEKRPHQHEKVLKTPVTHHRDHDHPYSRADKDTPRQGKAKQKRKLSWERWTR